MTRYHPVLVVLHWLLAVMIVAGLIMGGQVLAETANDDPFKLISLRLHMGMGLAILALMIVRLITKFLTAKPPHADIGNDAVNKLGRMAHLLLYLAVFAMCASGMALANMAGLPAIVFGGSSVPLPADFSVYAPRAVHGILATVLAVLIVGHVVGALYHQFVRKDRLFARMWFGD